MADFKPSKKSTRDFNGGVKVVDGDGITPDFLNNVVESQLFTQGLAVNSPDVSEMGNSGTPNVEIIETADGSARFKFKNLKGKDGLNGEDGKSPIPFLSPSSNIVPTVAQRGQFSVDVSQSDIYYVGGQFFSIVKGSEALLGRSWLCINEITAQQESFPYTQIDYQIKGVIEITGQTGVGITDVEISPATSSDDGITYELTVSLTNGQQVSAGDFLVPITDLSNYVDKTSNQEISGEKKFTSSVKVERTSGTADLGSTRLEITDNESGGNNVRYNAGSIDYTAGESHTHLDFPLDKVGALVVDSDLKNYVTTDTAQEITEKKTFSGGAEISDQDGTLSLLSSGFVRTSDQDGEPHYIDLPAESGELALKENVVSKSGDDTITGHKRFEGGVELAGGTSVYNGLSVSGGFKLETAEIEFPSSETFSPEAVQLPGHSGTLALTEDIPDIELSESGEGNAVTKVEANGHKITVTKGEKFATLDDTGRVPSSQLPSYVDDVMEFDTRETFPEQGEDGKIYIAIDTNLQYRWSGTGYVEISSSLALGETPQTAYAGDKGKKNADDIAELNQRLYTYELHYDYTAGEVADLIERMDAVEEKNTTQDEELNKKVNSTGGELKDTVVTFSDTEVTTDANVASGEKTSTLWAKVKRWFERLKKLAFKDTVGTADIDNKAVTSAKLDDSINSALSAANSALQSSDVSTLGKTGNLADGNQDATHRLVTDEDKKKWNGKQDALNFDDIPIAESANPVKSGGVKTELDKKANDADLAEIAKSGKLADATDDTTHRTVTDAEKEKWDAGAESAASAVQPEDLSDYVTTNTDQRIIGQKTFEQIIKTEGCTAENDYGTTTFDANGLQLILTNGGEQTNYVAGQIIYIKGDKNLSLLFPEPTSNVQTEHIATLSDLLDFISSTKKEKQTIASALTVNNSVEIITAAGYRIMLYQDRLGVGTAKGSTIYSGKSIIVSGDYVEEVGASTLDMVLNFPIDEQTSSTPQLTLATREWVNEHAGGGETALPDPTGHDGKILGVVEGQYALIDRTSLVTVTETENEANGITYTIEI